MNYRIYEIEVNFSNVCTAECIICSRPHGCGNKIFMEDDIFNILFEQLKDIKFQMLQTSGNGEALLNPRFLDYTERLKRGFNKRCKIWTYNNFSLWDKNVSKRVVETELFDKIHVRIDSLEKWIFQKCSNLNPDNVFENLKYFLSINDKIPVVILYNNIKDYYDRCQKLINKRPVRDYFSDKELDMVKDEEQKIYDYFKPYAKCDLEILRIGHSLWGERQTASKNTIAQCPKLNVIENVTWISPDGNVNLCMYEDRQDTFVLGNIKNEHILDIFNGKKRQEWLNKIRNREITEYPCTNPLLCGFPRE